MSENILGDDYTLAFGAISETGELARCPKGTTEIDLQMALALGRPPNDAAIDCDPPPNATVEVFWRGYQAGTLHRVQYVDGRTAYRFVSVTGKTVLWSAHRDGLLHEVKQILVNHSIAEDSGLSCKGTPQT